MAQVSVTVDSLLPLRRQKHDNKCNNPVSLLLNKDDKKCELRYCHDISVYRVQCDTQNNSRYWTQQHYNWQQQQQQQQQWRQQQRQQQQQHGLPLTL